MRTANRSKSVQPTATQDRAAFWGYCRRTAFAAQYRSEDRKLPFAIDAHFIDKLLVDQQWRCAVSGVALTPPTEAGKHWRGAFGPSLDRVVPELGYVPGNVRVVANIVNSAINEWGQDALLALLNAMRNRHG